MKTGWKTLIPLWILLAAAPALRAAEVDWKNSFLFYADNTEFFDDFRTGETILGQRTDSVVEAKVGPRGLLRAGLSVDFRSASDPDAVVRPLLTYELGLGAARFLVGALERAGDHGFLEPLQVSTLRLTRPVEYGLQWLQDEPDLQADLFLNWHRLNTPGRAETLDYGFTLRRALAPGFWAEAQFHGYHEGGQLYSVSLRNNWAPALGFRWRIWPFLGIDAFGAMSGDVGGFTLQGVELGGGGYLRLYLVPKEGMKVFALGWRARDFYFKEGDPHFSSFNAAQTHYRQDRWYGEVGVTDDIPLGGGVILGTETRFHFIEDQFAFSSRLTVEVPFEMNLLSEPRGK